MKLVSLYELAEQELRSSSSYQYGTAETRQKIDEWLKREEVIQSLGHRFVPVLGLHESLVWGFANAPALQTRTQGDRQHAMQYLNSKGFKKVIGQLETKIDSLL